MFHYKKTTKTTKSKPCMCESHLFSKYYIILLYLFLKLYIYSKVITSFVRLAPIHSGFIKYWDERLSPRV